MFLRIILSLLGVGVGLVLVIYSYKLTRITGEFSWAIKMFGAGGMDTAYKVIGVIVILVSLLFMFGLLAL